MEGKNWCSNTEGPLWTRNNTETEEEEEEELGKYLNPDRADHRAFRESGASGVDEI